VSQDAVSLHGVSVASLKLDSEDVLVRPAASEEQLSSGLWIMNKARLTWSGDCFYGIVVATGPGRLVQRPPTAHAILDFLWELAASDRDEDDDAEAPLAAFLAKSSERVRVPCPWKVSDHVCVRKGFGPEIDLREGRHHVVGRGNSQYGHGILAHLDPKHTHCWHDFEQGRSPSREGRLAKCCECSLEEVIQVRLPTCNPKVAGPRLLETQLGHKVYETDLGRADPVPEYGPLEGVRGAAGELRPEEHTGD